MLGDEKQGRGSHTSGEGGDGKKKEEDECIVTTNPTTSRSPSATLRNTSRRTQAFGKVANLRLFAGIINDIKSRAPYYVSDWRDAWNYRVIPAIVLIFFAKWVRPSR